MMKKIYVCNVEIQIKKTLLKAKEILLKKMSKYQNI